MGKSIELPRIAPGSVRPVRLLTVKESAEYLGTSDKHIRRMLMEREIPFIQHVKGRSKYQIDIEDLNKWIEHSKVRA